MNGECKESIFTEMRFEKREDCYYDTETGLEWSLESHGPMSWQEMIDFCMTLGSGWRLPTIHELITLVDYNEFKPATKLPDMESTCYWSGNTSAAYMDYAWYVGFIIGDVRDFRKAGFFHARYVRD